MGTSETTPGLERAGPRQLERFDSWKEIAAHLGRSVSTVQRWERQEGLPVHRHLHNKQGTVYAFRTEVDAWWQDRRLRLEPTPEPTRWVRLRGALGPRGSAAFLVLTLGAAAAAAFFAWRAVRGMAVPVETARPVRVTSEAGSELDPALSPDGSRLAYVGQGTEGGGFDLYVQGLAGGAPLRLTRSGAVCCPAWSPDGHAIAFVRQAGGEGAVLTVPAAGGAERFLTTLAPWFGLTLAWSPDGGRLAYPDRTASTAAYSLVVLDLGTLREEPATRPGAGELGDAFPAWSPDGRSLAFARVSASGDALPADVYLTTLGGAEPRRLTFDAALVGGLAWSADGRDLVYAAVRKGEDPRVYRVAVAGGRPAPVPGPRLTEVIAETASAVSRDLRLSVARSGRLAYVKASYDTNIWTLPNPWAGGAPAQAAPRRLIASTLPDDAPQVSPDGRTIAFATSRSGHSEIWTCARDGTTCAALTRSAVHSGTPRFSPDGRRIAYDSRPDGHSDVFVMDLATREATRVTTSPAEDVVASWSRDGRFLYYASNRSGSWEVWRTDVEKGASLQLTREGGFAAFEGRGAVFFTRASSPGLWRMPLTGGPAARVADGPRCWGHFAVGPDGVIVMNEAGDGGTSVQLVPEGGAAPLRAGPFPFTAPCAEASLALTPDGREIFYVAAEKAADIMMTELPR